MLIFFFLCCPLSPLFLGLPWHKWQNFCYCPQIHGTLLFCFKYVFILLFRLVNFYGSLLKFTDSYLYTTLSPSSEFSFQLYCFSVLKLSTVLLNNFHIFAQIFYSIDLKIFHDWLLEHFYDSFFKVFVRSNICVILALISTDCLSACWVILDFIQDILNIMRLWVLFKSYRECW